MGSASNIEELKPQSPRQSSSRDLINPLGSTAGNIKVPNDAASLPAANSDATDHPTLSQHQVNTRSKWLEQLTRQQKFLQHLITPRFVQLSSSARSKGSK